MAPVFVPMFMLLGYSPELTQAAYRIGDSTSNVIAPMMSYFALIVAFSRALRQDLRHRHRRRHDAALYRGLPRLLVRDAGDLDAPRPAGRPRRGAVPVAAAAPRVGAARARHRLLRTCRPISTEQPIQLAHRLACKLRVGSQHANDNPTVTHVRQLVRVGGDAVEGRTLIVASPRTNHSPAPDRKPLKKARMFPDDGLRRRFICARTNLAISGAERTAANVDAHSLHRSSIRLDTRIQRYRASSACSSSSVVPRAWTINRLILP